MKKIQLELDPEELQVLVQALDTHVRQHGLQVAKNAIVVLQLLQSAANENPKDSEK